MQPRVEEGDLSLDIDTSLVSYTAYLSCSKDCTLSSLKSIILHIPPAIYCPP